MTKQMPTTTDIAHQTVRVLPHVAHEYTGVEVPATVRPNAKQARDAALEEARFTLIVRAARGPLDRTRYLRAVGAISRANFDYKAKLRGVFPAAYSHLFDEATPPTKAKLRECARWEAAEVAARREIEAILTRVEDTL